MQIMLTEHLKQFRLEAQVNDMLTAADLSSRQLESSSRTALYRFTELLSAVHSGNTPVDLLSFHDLETVKHRAVVGDERLSRDYRRMDSVVLPLNSNHTLMIATRIAVTSAPRPLYEVIAIPHYDNEGRWVRPVVPHDFFVVQGQGFQRLDQVQAANCLEHPCVLNQPEILYSQHPCGVTIAQQVHKSACETELAVPEANFFRMTYNKKYLIYSVRDEGTTVELFCKQDGPGVIKRMHLRNAGSLLTLPGCTWRDPVSNQEFDGPVRTMEESVALSDKSLLGSLNTQANLPTYTGGVHFQKKDRVVSQVMAGLTKVEKKTETQFTWAYAIGGIGLFTGCAGFAAYLLGYWKVKGSVGRVKTRVNAVVGNVSALQASAKTAVASVAPIARAAHAHLVQPVLDRFVAPPDLPPGYTPPVPNRSILRPSSSGSRLAGPSEFERTSSFRRPPTTSASEGPTPSTAQLLGHHEAARVHFRVGDTEHYTAVTGPGSLPARQSARHLAINGGAESESWHVDQH